MDNRRFGEKMNQAKNMISAVIYTINNPDRVINLVNDIVDYVEEVVVIDSSSPENFDRLSKNLEGKAKLYNLIPLGIVEPFQKVGAELCKNEWIFHLDDDEVPSKELLEVLETDEEIASYLILRSEGVRGFQRYHPRFYNKRKMFFSGVIHWGLIPCGKTKPLDKLLYHYEKPSYKKWRNYALLDSYFTGYKILWIVNNKRWHIWEKGGEQIAEMFNKLFKKQFVFGRKIGWLLATIEYLFANTIYALKEPDKIKYRLMKILYEIFIFLNIIKDFDRKIKIWENLFRAGSLNDYLCLNTIDDLEKLRNKNKKGLELLISLIEEKAEV